MFNFQFWMPKKRSIFIHSLRPLVPTTYIINTAIRRSIWTHGTWSPGKWVSCPGWLWTWTYCCGAWSRWLRWGGESDPQPPDPRSDNSRRTETCLSCTDGPSDSRCSGWPVRNQDHTHIRICSIVHSNCDHLHAILYYSCMLIFSEYIQCQLENAGGSLSEHLSLLMF